MLIQIHDLSFAYNGKTVLSDISVDVDEGQRWAVIGMNGAGKSTLIRCIAGLERVPPGSISFDGKDVGQYRAKDLAKVMAYVPQAQGRAAPFTVSEYVLMGRFPYQGFMATPTEEDRRIVDEALELTDTTDFARRQMNTLSGGELQRVLIAGAVSQRTRVLLLDEPATFLDPLHQDLVRKALERIHAEFNTTVLTVTHDVNDAIARSSNILALVGGKGYYAGDAGEFVSRCPGILQKVYGMEFAEADLAGSSRKIVVPC